VWAIRCEVRVLDNGGNVTDGACLAAAAALKAFKRPDVTTEGDKVTVRTLGEV
jgi:exosome complex component RRP45